MPFIHIKSLPLDRTFDVAPVIEALCRDLADATSVDLKRAYEQG